MRMMKKKKSEKTNNVGYMPKNVSINSSHVTKLLSNEKKNKKE